MRGTRSYKQTIIISACLSNITNYDNGKRTRALKDMLRDLDIEHHEALGNYKGLLEDCFVVILKTIEEYQVVRDLAFHSFKQESILFQNTRGLASLVYPNGTREKLGLLREMPKALAMKQGSYTIFNDHYYAIKVVV